MAAFLEQRYHDAYSAARKVSTWGTLALIFSLILGVIDIMITFVAFAAGPTTAASAVGVTVFGGGLVIIGTGFVTNILAKAVAHILITTTDTAVNTSPFMSPELKWAALTSQKPQLATHGNENVGTTSA